MTVKVIRGSIGPFDTVTLQNDRLKAVVIPALGGRVWELEDRVRDRQWIWHRPSVPLRAAPSGSVYDEVWAGGWEELFPNDAECQFEGRSLPDHGEWWTSEWNVAEVRAGPEASLELRTTLSVIRADCTKTFRLGPGSSTLSARYRIRSNEVQPFHFLFKQHLPIAVTPDCRLALPGGRVKPVDAAFSTILRSTETFRWPLSSAEDANPTDLRRIPAASDRKQEFVYVHELPAGWCGVQDLGRAASLRVDFDTDTLPYVWLFLSYGGWRDLYTAVLEPCSNMPKDLSEAVRAGQSASLAPGGVFETAVSATLGGLTLDN